MVNGNYRVYSETTPASDNENRENDTRAGERKYKRKQNRSANELYKTLNMRQIDNETDSIKYERRIKEPRLLRYVSSDAVRERYVTDHHLECYDEPAKRHTFAKKAKNPIDGANHYTHSRSSSNCSSPTGNLPTISEHGEQYGTFRVQVPSSVTDDVEFERKLDKYFGKPRDEKYSTKVGYHGTHPDSLCRVPMDSGSGSQTRRALRLLCWPACLIVLCIALALFVYFVMPDSMDENFDTVNATDWKANVEGEHYHQEPTLQSWIKDSNTIEMKSTAQSPTAERSSTKTPEIDFYNAETESYSEDVKNQEIIPDDTSNGNVNLPIQPIFPTHISPEVQYGNEKADDEKRRTPKLFLSEVLDPDDTSENPSKPHITQKPEKPLAIYFQHDGLGSAEAINLSDNLNETNENNYEEKNVENDKNQNIYLNPNSLKKDHFQILPKTSIEAEDQAPVKADVKFTSGHSKLFGISIEDAAKMQSTTPNSVYNTRVSPTLPVLRDLDDATAKYPMNINNDGQPQCRSTRLALCRGVLPYDLASTAVTPGGIEITSLVAQLEHLVATNCSNRVQQFACALLEPECSPPPYPPRLPCYHLCTAISEDCEDLIPHDLQPVFQCNLYPHNNCVPAHSPCNHEEFQCSDGTCILKNNVCDGRFDCPAGDDEESCTNCRSDEFSCPSGGCVVRRWVCDGYTDCPNGEDESEAACTSEAAARLLVGEQSEASDPAPARLPHPLQLRRPGDSDELLMTSDSGNAYRRNYTRPRPSLSRLTPYSRKLPQNSDEKLSVINDVSKTTMSSSNNLSSQKENNSSNDASIYSRSKSEDIQKQEIKTDPMNLDLLMNIYKDVMKIENEHGNTQKGFSAPEASTKPVTRFDKSIGKLQKMMKDAELMTKTPVESSTKSAERSLIDNSKVMTKSEELLMLEDVGLVSAHASPCPSSELRCVDGRCITLAQLCDGTIDCSDHADEENCYT